MKRKDVLEKLATDEHYYGSFGKNYLSNSDIYRLVNDPVGFKISKEQGLQQTSTPEMLFGRYFHHEMLEPEKTNDYVSVNVKSRNAKAYQDAKLEHGEELLLDMEIDKAKRMCDKLLNNKEVFDLLDLQDSEREVPEYGIVLDGGKYLWKGKADLINRKQNLIIDLKTTSSLERFRSSAYKYNYHSQAYIYKQLFCLDMILVVIDKNNFQIAITPFSDYALEQGEEKVRQAEDIVHRFIDPTGAGEDASQHLIKFSI